MALSLKTALVTLLGVIWIFGGNASVYAAGTESGDPISFLQQHCLGCHGEKKQKGDRRFDHLELNFDDEDTAFEWQEILDMVNLGEMPPEDEPQPSDE